jgi:hypothetical protein
VHTLQGAAATPSRQRPQPASGAPPGLGEFYGFLVDTLLDCQDPELLPGLPHRAKGADGGVSYNAVAAWIEEHSGDVANILSHRELPPAPREETVYISVMRRGDKCRVKTGCTKASDVHAVARRHLKGDLWVGLLELRVPEGRGRQAKDKVKGAIRLAVGKTDLSKRECTRDKLEVHIRLASRLEFWEKCLKYASRLPVGNNSIPKVTLNPDFVNKEAAAAPTAAAAAAAPDIPAGVTAADVADAVAAAPPDAASAPRKGKGRGKAASKDKRSAAPQEHSA